MQKGPLYVLGCYILWGTLPVFWKLLSAVDSFYVLGSRVAWSAVFTALLLALRRDGFAGVRAALGNRKELGKLVLAGCVICVNWGSYIWAVSNGHLLDASLAYYMHPILAILLGMLLFRETLSLLRWLSVAVVFTGIVIAVIRYEQIPWLALLIGGSFAVYGAIKKTVSADSVTATFLESVLFTPLFFGIMLWMDGKGTGAAGVLQGWQWLLLPMAGVVTSVPLVLFSKGMQSTSMALSGILMYINPTMQLLISVWLYHETFTATHGILFAFVWGGLILYLLSGFRKGRKEERS